MTRAYHQAHNIIKRHVNAGPDDIIITAGFGMTGVIAKFQRMMGLKMCAQLTDNKCLKEKNRPVVFVTHMEHHSNHTSWFETISDVVVLQPDKDLLVDPEELRRQLELYKDRTTKIGAFTACSNVTGVRTPYYTLAKLMHEYGGHCFIDFAASAPYEVINMHPADPLEQLDAIMFSPHKFLGGPDLQVYSFLTRQCIITVPRTNRAAELLTGQIPGVSLSMLMILKHVRTVAHPVLCRLYEVLYALN
jgi:selenocysteine lyase/cysteine desulfurase